MKKLFTLSVIAWVSLYAMPQQFTSVSFNPGSPTVFGANEILTINYEYTKQDGDLDVKLWPYYQDYILGVFAVQTSGVLTANSGSGWATLSCDGMGSGQRVDKIRLEFCLAGTNTPIAWVEYPVNYFWINMYIWDVQFNPPSPFGLEPGTTIQVQYNYIAQLPNDLVVKCVAKFNGSEVANASYSAPFPITQQRGTGTGTFTLTSDGSVDEVYLYFYYSPFMGQLGMGSLSTVNYTFKEYTISNVSFSPPSGAWLLPDQPISVTFDYDGPAGGILFYPRAHYQGDINPLANYTNSPVYDAASGSATREFWLRGDGYIDELLIRIRRQSDWEILKEITVPVNYRFLNYNVSNLSFNPPSPARVAPEQLITLTFDYEKPDGPIRAFATPYFEGSIPTGVLADGSPTIIENQGQLSRQFGLNIPGQIDAVHLTLTSADQNQTIYYSQMIPVSFTFIPYDFFDITVDPSPGSSLAVNEDVYATFSYTKPDGPVFAYAIPWLGTGPAPGELHSGSDTDLINDNSGRTDRSFHLTQAGSSDKIRLLFTDTSVDRNPIYEELLDAGYTWTGSEGIDENKLTARFKVFPVPCRSELYLTNEYPGPWSYTLLSREGKLIETCQTDQQIEKLQMESLPPGFYLIRIVSAEGTIIRSLIKE